MLGSRGTTLPVVFFLVWYLLLLLCISLKWKILLLHKILTKIFIKLFLKTTWLNMKLSVADAYTVQHGCNESAHRKATWALPLTCTGVGGSTCLGQRDAGRNSVRNEYEQWLIIPDPLDPNPWLLTSWMKSTLDLHSIAKPSHVTKVWWKAGVVTKKFVLPPCVADKNIYA